MIERGAVARDVVIVACAISAGVHAALVHHHGASFVAAAAILLALAVAVTRRPTPIAFAAAAATFVGLLSAYAVEVVGGGEALSGVGLATKAVEIGGLLAAGRLLRPGSPRSSRPIPLALTVMITCFSALVVLAAAHGPGGHA